MTATHSKMEKLSFSGKDEHFTVFTEQFESRMHILNVEKFLEDKLIVPAYREDETRGDETTRVKAEDERNKQRFIVWCELSQCLDKASINFIRLHKPDGVEAWKAIVGKYRSTERPRIQTLLTQLAGLKMAPGEKVTDYLTRAEGIRLDLQEAGEMTSNAMFSAIVLKCLPPTFESIATVLNFGPRNGYKKSKQDLINFTYTRAQPGTDVASNAFHSRGGNSSRKITCFKCQKEEHMARDCRSKEIGRASSAMRRGILQGIARARRGSPVAPAGVQRSNASSASEALNGLQRKKDSSY